jgi:hypothetical protein
MKLLFVLLFITCLVSCDDNPRDKTDGPCDSSALRKIPVDIKIATIHKHKN